MAKNNEFSFDENADWDFGKTGTDTTDVGTVTSNVRGATIDDDDDDDADETPANLEEGKGVVVKEEEDLEVKVIKPEVKETPKPSKEKPKETDTTKTKEELEEEELEEERNNLSFEDEDELEGKNKDNKVVKPKAETAPVEEDEDVFTPLLTDLKEKGIFQNVEIPKDKKFTEDEFFDTLNEEAEIRASEIIEAMSEKAGDEGKAYLKHLKNGGTTRDFVEAYYGSGIDYDKFDADNEEEREALLKFYLKSVEEKDDEEATSYITHLKDTGKDKSMATKWAAKLKLADDTAKEQLETKLKESNKAKEEKAKKFNTELVELIEATDNVSGVPISKEDKKKLPSILTKNTVKVGKDRYTTPFNVKLSKILRPETKEDKAKLVLLAKLIDSDFDLSGVVVKAETRVTKNAKSRIAAAKTGQLRSSASGTARQHFAELIDG